MDRLKHFHDLLAFLIFFFQVSPIFPQKPYSHPCFPLILTQFILCSLSHQSQRSFHSLSFPCRQSLFRLFFPSAFSSGSLQTCSPCSHVDDDLRCGSAGTSSHKELCECSEVKGEGEQRPAGRALCSSLASLECSTTSVAKVGGKSCLVHPTASISLPYPLFSFPRQEE